MYQAALNVDSTFWAPLALGGMAFFFAYVAIIDPRVKAGYLWAIPACVVLAYATFYLGLACGVAENTSELFQSRCDGRVYLWPLVGIPILLVVPVATRWWWYGIAAWLSGLVVLILSIGIPWVLLANA